MYAFIAVSPTIIPSMMNQTVIEQNSAIFTCEVQTTTLSNTSISWKVNGSTLDMFNVKYALTEQLLNSTLIQSTLKILNVTLFDAGVYSCCAENLAGSDVANGILFVHGIGMFIHTLYLLNLHCIP